MGSLVMPNSELLYTHFYRIAWQKTENVVGRRMRRRALEEEARRRVGDRRATRDLGQQGADEKSLVLGSKASTTYESMMITANLGISTKHQKRAARLALARVLKTE